MKLFKVLETSFENFDNTIRTYLSKMLGASGLQYSYSQIFGVIFEGIKGVMQNAMFYIEDAITEQNVETAFRKTSIYSLAKLSGYEAYYGSAATGILNCNISVNNLSDIKYNKIYIKNGSSVLNNNTGIQYLLYLPTDFITIDLSKPFVTTKLKIVQGYWKTSSYVSIGEQLETVHITTGGLYDRDYIEVLVDGEKWSSAPCLYDMTEDSKEYVISVGYNNELDIMFGNGIYGKKLNPGQTIIIRYICHNGESGNIFIDEPTDFELNNSVYNYNGDVISKTDFLKLTLETSISGGSESDNTDNIKQMIGYNSRSLVLASENNFRQFLNRFSFVGQSNIWHDNNSLNINIACITNYKKYITNTDDFYNLAVNNKLLLDDAQKQMILDTLNNSNKTFAGISIKFAEPVIYKYSIIFYIRLKENYDRETIQELISTEIANYFVSLPSNTNIISKSDIIKLLVDKIPYLESIDLTFISDINERAFKDGFYYKTELVNKNGILQYQKVKKIYEPNSPVGLDDFGNISVDGKFEIPIINNGVHYYSDDKTSNVEITLPAIQCVFI